MDALATMRAFGRAEDLDLPFEGASGEHSRPALVTALLAQCAGGDARHWWQQPVGARIAALLQLYAFNEGMAQVELSARCGHAACGEVFAFDLPLAPLAALAPQAEHWTVPLPPGRQATLRRPNGSDLARWQAARPASRQAALRRMLADLVVDGVEGDWWQPQDEATLAAALEQADPLVALSVAADCPACGRAQPVDVDLEGLVLARFAARQRALLYEVHRLATHYGWTEAEALAVPPARRAAYLRLIDAEAAR